MIKSILFAIALAMVVPGVTNAQVVYTKKIGPSGYLGLSFREEVVAEGDAKTTETIRVGQVSKDSPAEKAGVKPGDEILRINGLMATNGKFAAIARTLAEGDTVKLRIKREGTERDITIVAAARPAGYGLTREITIAPDSIRRRMLKYLDSARVHLDSLRLPDIHVRHSNDSLFSFHIGRHGVLRDTLMFRRHGGELGPAAIFHSMELGTRAIGGAEFSEMNEGLAQYFNGRRGLLTLRVTAETPADRAGLQSGDVVLKAKDRTLDKISDLRSIIAANPEGVKLEVSRKGQIRTLELKTRQR